jgi:hypothetical protein
MAVVIPENTESITGDSASPESILEGAPKDPQPDRIKRMVRLAPQPGSARARVSAADKKDIRAKISMMLLFPGGLWARADDYCGPAFMKVIPQLSEDLADILSDNAEIVAWFASGAGWLKYLKLLSTLQPVAEMMWQHHISKTVGEEVAQNGSASPDWERYTVPRPGTFAAQSARSVPTADQINQA